MIQIKNPCDASWQEMTPAESGKYCGACEKVVVDFSKMNDSQIKEYFTQYTSQKTCGRFLSSQLERPLIIPASTRINKFLNKLNQLPVTRTVLFFLTSASMWISSCVKNNNEEMITGDSIAVTENYNTQLPEDSIAGFENDSIHSPGFIIPVIKPQDEVMGEVAPRHIIKMLPPQVLMGDVCVSPPDNPDTVALTIVVPGKDTSYTIHSTMGAVMMVDTISQKIKRKKK